MARGRGRSKGRRRSPVKGVTPSRVKAYRALRSKGYSQERAAKIANKGKAFSGRSEMARRGAANRGR